MINLDFLLKDLSIHLHTEVRQYTTAGQLISCFCSIYQFQNPYADENMLSDLCILSHQHDFPMICSIDQKAAFLLIPIEDSILCAGPFLLSSLHLLKYEIHSSVLIDDEYFKTLPAHDVFTLQERALFLYNLFHLKVLDKDAFINENYKMNDSVFEIQQNFSQIIFTNHENETKHNPYEQELRELTSIEEGNLEQLQNSINEDFSGSYGTLSDDLLRHAKNMGIVVITLASRAAIRGGLLPEISFSLVDSYIQQLEKTNDFSALTYLIRQAEFQYAKLVHDLKSNYPNQTRQKIHPKIRQCKDYIFTHLHGKFFIQDIADELQINASYLAELFKKYEGVSISDFIIQEKIKLIKNLLIYSQYSYIEIANYLGFSSQSHMGQHFKRITGYTLRQFRNAFQSENFMAEE